MDAGSEDDLLELNVLSNLDEIYMQKIRAKFGFEPLVRADKISLVLAFSARTRGSNPN
jgi:hypothetical protein